MKQRSVERAVVMLTARSTWQRSVKDVRFPCPVDLAKGEFRAAYSFAETVVEIRFGTDIVATPERLTCGALRSFNKIQTVVIHKIDTFYLR